MSTAKKHKRDHKLDMYLREGEAGMVLEEPEPCAQCGFEIATGEQCSLWTTDKWFMHLLCRSDLHELACCVNGDDNPYGVISEVDDEGEWVHLEYGDLESVAGQVLQSIPGGGLQYWVDEAVVAQLSDFQSLKPIFERLRKEHPSSDQVRAEWKKKKEARLAVGR